MPPRLLRQITHSFTCSHYELQPHIFPSRPHLSLPTSLISAKLCPLPRVLFILPQAFFRARLKPTPTSSEEPAQIPLPESTDQRAL